MIDLYGAEPKTESNTWGPAISPGKTFGFYVDAVSLWELLSDRRPYAFVVDEKKKDPKQDCK